MTNTLSKDVTDEQLNRIISIESAGKPDAAPPKGTAGGLGQFLAGTWTDTGKKHYPALVKKYGASWVAMRKGKATATLQLMMLARFTEDNVNGLGTGWKNGDLYLAHFLGLGDARKVFHASPDTKMGTLVNAKVIENNSTIMSADTTAAYVRGWAQNAMETRWPKLGMKDWVAMWYNADEAAAYLGAPVAAPEDVTPVKEEDEEEPAAPASTDVALPKGTVIRGDTETWWVQFRLQRMHYGPSMLDGRYGGKTSAAIAAFLNDYPPAVTSRLTPPKSNEEFIALRDELKAELTAAEADGWKRPVTEARKEASPEVVKEVAPETKPIQRNVSVGIWGALGTAITAFFQYAGDSIKSAWDFFTENKDNIPDSVKDPSTLSWLWTKITTLPGWVWLSVACLTFLFFVFNSSSGLKTIIDKVKTGER